MQGAERAAGQAIACDGMETFAVWRISRGADPDAVHALVDCAAERPGSKARPDCESLVPNDQSDEFVRALSECDENWTDKGLAPPSRRR